MTNTLAGRRLLVVEDDYYLADDLARALGAEGAEVVGPVSNIDSALDLLATPNSCMGRSSTSTSTEKWPFPLPTSYCSGEFPSFSQPDTTKTSFQRGTVTCRGARSQPMPRPSYALCLAEICRPIRIN
ncbi:hypothetical protein [Bradyrhizobium sp. ORS 375]|uniref:hypothetical protein n=1 Tax=Bradyrhizobium sp. (strain ORS 375) TaxID=566679 RepID=UPI0032DFCA46